MIELSKAESHRRRSSMSESGMLSLSGSFLDTTTPDKDGAVGDVTLTIPTPQDLKAMSPRHQVFMELLHTEMNYVEILETIVEVRESLITPCVGTRAFNSTFSLFFSSTETGV